LSFFTDSVWAYQILGYVPENFIGIHLNGCNFGAFAIFPRDYSRIRRLPSAAGMKAGLVECDSIFVNRKNGCFGLKAMIILKVKTDSGIDLHI
jgi:hypothetical protein